MLVYASGRVPRCCTRCCTKSALNNQGKAQGLAYAPPRRFCALSAVVALAREDSPSRPVGNLGYVASGYIFEPDPELCTDVG